MKSAVLRKAEKKSQSMISSSTNRNEIVSLTENFIMPFEIRGPSFDFGKINVYDPKKTVRVQPKLQINQPGDKYEQEADRISQKVVLPGNAGSIQESENPILQGKLLAEEITTGATAELHRKCKKCKEEEEERMLHKKESSGSTPMVSKSFQSQLNSSQGSGKPMDYQTNQSMSSKFGIDFSQVRIHNDTKAAQLSQSINAKAFTLGNDIYFNRSEYKPQTKGGQKLLAHELVHTVQQGREIRRQPDRFGAPPIDYEFISDPLERKMRMETDYAVFLWKDAIKRLEKGELTDEDLNNERLLNRMTGLKSSEVIDLIRKIKDFQKRKDEERAAALKSGKKNIEPVKTAKIIEWLEVRKLISTPMDKNATVTYNALNEIENYKISLKDVNITVKKDTSSTAGNVTKPKTNFEGSFKWTVKDGKIINLKKDGESFNPTSLEVEINTQYQGDPNETSAYGKGTTAEDKSNKTTTFRVHEGQHGIDFIDYLKNKPLPVSLSGGINGNLTPGQFKEILEYVQGITKESCELTDQSGFSQDDYLKSEEGKKSGIKSCKTP
ncbi:MAG TPA: DUF4157 domain-containing protein [Gillisia sp.]|nr:DUF4157 domain-containing protein [Gillisia sp.]